MAVWKKDRRWLLTFWTVLLGLIGIAVFSYARLENYRALAIDFTKMKPGDTLNVYGLTRRQEGSIKLGFAEAHEPPDIGVYGNHIIRYFGSDAFGRDDDASYFFNYFYANLSLPEIERYLLRVEKVGHLPRKLLIIQITPPNADNGDFIINWGNELPPNIIMSGVDLTTFAGLSQSFRIVPLVIENWIAEILNYNTFILGLFHDSPSERQISPAKCTQRQKTWVERLPFTMQGFFRSYSDGAFFCNPRTWGGAFRPDGSVSDPVKADGVTPIRVEGEPLRGNQFLAASERGLNNNDDLEIARLLSTINAIAIRNGLQAIFLIPPVYEEGRRTSVVNQILDRALARVPEVKIIDHRDLKPHPSFFFDHIHPSPEYYKFLVTQIRQTRI